MSAVADWDPRIQPKYGHARTGSRQSVGSVSTNRLQRARLSVQHERDATREGSISMSLGGAGSGDFNSIGDRRVEAEWSADEPAMLQLYGLTSLQPTQWEGAEETDPDPAARSQSVTNTTAARGPLSKRDEPDALGLFRGGILAANPDLTPEQRTGVLLTSKTFDPKTFLSAVHPHATFEDLNMGREYLKDSLEQRSGALRMLVETEWDRFVAVKGATETVYDEMKEGLLAEGEDYGVRDLREALKNASARSDIVFQPTLEARMKAERLRSTLGVFERSKFFFNLPGVLGEAVQAGKYDVALLAYKKGRYILASRPSQLLGLPPASTPQQKLQHKRIFDRVWGQVEKIVGDLRATLSKRLRDTKRGLHEVEKTIEILLELDPTDDPVWIFFDTHHRHILQLLRSSSASSTSRISVAMDNVSDEDLDEQKLAGDLRSCVQSLDSLDGENIRERAAGWAIWKLVYDLVKDLSDVMQQTLPSFWKVAKGYMEGKYQKKEVSAPSASANRRSPAQCRAMSQEIVALYASLLTQFFHLAATNSLDAYHPQPAASEEATPTPPIPSFVPPNSNSMTTSHWLLRILNELTDCTSDLNALELAGEATSSLKEVVASARWRFEEAMCAVWVRDAKLFYHLERWRSDSDEPSTTLYLRQIAAFQKWCTVSAYKIAGGAEERINLLNSTTTSAALSSAARSKPDPGVGSDFVRKVQSAYLDALYAFLDGLVELAFSAPEAIFAPEQPQTRLKRVFTARNEDPRSKEIDVHNVDIRILLTVSNLSHLRITQLSRMINQFQALFKVDLSSEVETLMAVVDQLDKILFDDYVKRKSVDVARILRKGVLGGSIDWYNAPKPTEVHSFVYDALLSLVLVHAQVTATAKPLLERTLGALVEELAKEALDSFSRVERFGMGGMLQATLEIEFMHQTLSQHVSPVANQTLQSIYSTISQSYYRKPSSNSAGELQQELEGLKRTLMASRRATALQFLCMRRPRGDGSAKDAKSDKDAVASAVAQATK